MTTRPRDRMDGGAGFSVCSHQNSNTLETHTTGSPECTASWPAWSSGNTSSSLLFLFLLLSFCFVSFLARHTTNSSHFSHWENSAHTLLSETEWNHWITSTNRPTGHFHTFLGDFHILPCELLGFSAKIHKTLNGWSRLEQILRLPVVVGSGIPSEAASHSELVPISFSVDFSSVSVRFSWMFLLDKLLLFEIVGDGTRESFYSTECRLINSGTSVSDLVKIIRCKWEIYKENVVKVVWLSEQNALFTHSLHCFSEIHWNFILKGNIDFDWLQHFV